MTAEKSTRPLRIGIATDALHERTVDGEVRIANGGVGVYVHQLVSHLLAIDPVNQYFLIRFGPGQLDIYRHPRARCIFLPASKIKRAAALLGGLYSRPARELELDLMHFPNMFGGGWLRAPARQIATLHDLTPILLPSTHPMTRVIATRLIIARSLRRSDRIIVPSNATARDLVDKGLAPPERIVCIPEGVNPAMRRVAPTAEFAARKLDSLIEPRKQLGWPGFLRSWKALVFNEH